MSRTRRIIIAAFAVLGLTAGTAAVTVPALTAATAAAPASYYHG